MRDFLVFREQMPRCHHPRIIPAHEGQDHIADADKMVGLTLRARVRAEEWPPVWVDRGPAGVESGKHRLRLAAGRSKPAARSR